jgi:hypothetical protein
MLEVEPARTLRGLYRWRWCQAAEYCGGTPFELTAVSAVVAAVAAGLAEGEGAAVVVGAGAGEFAATTGLAGETAGEAAAFAAGEVVGDVAAFVAGAASGDAEGAGLASSEGARLPMFERSGPSLILPSIAGRSKM